MRIDRMLSIVITLLYKERISARELSNKFDVSVRTIYRDIEAINRAGIPIVPYSGSSGGFGLMDNFKLDRRLLSMEDFIYILSSLKGINETLDNRDIENAIDKISSMIPKEKSEQAEMMMEHIVFDMIPWGYARKQTDKVKAIHLSIVNKNIVEFYYTDQGGKGGRRVVEPMTLVFKGSAWYLFGYCRKREDYRIFRLSRISELNNLSSSFKLRTMTYKEFSRREGKSEKRIRYIFKFQPELRQLVEDYFDEKFISVGKDGVVTVNGLFPESDWFLFGLLSYGDKVEVIEPESLKKEMITAVKKILSLYNADTMVSQ